MAAGSRIWATLKATPPFVRAMRTNAFIKQKSAEVEQSTPPFVKDFSRYLFICLGWLPVVLFVNNHVFEVTMIRGPSMSPFFNERYNETTWGDICLAKKFKVQENLERGMIITFSNPLRPEALTTKRIIGLPGDIVHTKPPFTSSYIRVPPHHVWVEGDGGGDLTLDSNTYGPVSIRLIQGNITHILWPFHKAGRVKFWEHPDRLAALRE
ncbi:unnamed protein product [Discula destructiva]